MAMAQTDIDNERWKEWTRGSSPIKGPLLALLLDSPGYPYQLRGRLYWRLGGARKIDPPDINRLCKQFEKLGLASSHVADSERTGQRVRIYQATELASRAVAEWMQSPLPVVTARGELWTRLAVSQPEHAPYLLEALDKYRKACVKLLGENGEKYPVNTWSGMERELARKGANLMIEAEIQLIDLAHGYIANFPGARDVSAVV
jgi:DNA-binding PadR family transcriptional regulator